MTTSAPSRSRVPCTGSAGSSPAITSCSPISPGPVLRPSAATSASVSARMTLSCRLPPVPFMSPKLPRCSTTVARSTGTRAQWSAGRRSTSPGVYAMLTTRATLLPLPPQNRLLGRFPLVRPADRQRVRSLLQERRVLLDDLQEHVRERVQRLLALGLRRLHHQGLGNDQWEVHRRRVE